jgi:hypothetical protein
MAQYKGHGQASGRQESFPGDFQEGLFRTTELNFFGSADFYQLC